MISAVFANQKNGDFINAIEFNSKDLITVVYSRKGYEIVGSYLFLNNKLKILAGSNYKKPDADSVHLPENFSKLFYLLGAQYQFIKFASVYSEYRYNDNSVNGLGIDRLNVFMVGLRIDFNRTWSRNIGLNQ